MRTTELNSRRRSIEWYLNSLGTKVEIFSTTKVSDGAGGWTRGDPVSRGIFQLRVIDPRAANAPGTLVDAPEALLVGKKQRRRGFDLMLVGSWNVPLETNDQFQIGSVWYRIEHVYKGRDRVVAGATEK